MKKTACAVALSLGLATSAYAKGKTFAYDAPKDKVFAVVMSIVADEQWTFEAGNPALGTISFRSGTKECSVLVTGLSAVKTQVTVNIKAPRAGLGKLSTGLGIDEEHVKKMLIEKLDERLGVKGVKAVK